ncbi:Uncharacterized protein FKW44_024932 [Caligus rogercresseyi]|uniref:Zinc finger BED domain-containing protein 5 n=1 Tax=Caligus rogercresseyi TaxID=217165 RepID=A0A7T8GKL2_CALRO|nr:Uncharacterized protein FKW44_024932 [Caligus rogercresseyi]
MASTSKKRKWNETYQQYGFTKFSRDGLDAAQCIHCSTVLANCSLKPAKLSHHQSNLHPNIELTDEDLEAKRKCFDKQVALKIAKRKKAHTIGEELIKPCAEIMVRNVLGDKAKREISARLQPPALRNDGTGNRLDPYEPPLPHSGSLGLAGKVLARVFEMHTEMETRGDHRHENYKNSEFLMKLAYLADIFGTLNEVNVTLQGLEASVSDVKDKLAGLGARIALWIRRLHRGNVAAFPLLDAFLLDKQLDLPDDLKESIAAHFERLTSEFKAYFDGVEPAYYPWYKDPFGAVVNNEMEEAEELLMLRESAVAKAEFRKLSLSEFWLQQQDTYPRLCNKAAQMFLPFPTTYLCEAGSSVMFDLKPKKRNRLEMSNDMRLACSGTKPNILKLDADCKEQVSH